MDRYTVSELVQKFGYPESKIRRRIKKGLLPTIKEKDGHQEVIKVLVESEDLLLSVIEGREIQAVASEQMTIECDESQEVKESEFVRDSGSFERWGNNQMLEFCRELYGQNKLLMEDIKQYAELAGQTKLLTDSEHQTKQEYFKIVQENKQLLQEKAIVETENRLINKQLEELKQKLDTVEKKEKINIQVSKEPALIEFLRKL